MRVDTSKENKALVELITNPSAIIFLDANFFIPPDRSDSMSGAHSISFQQYCSIWLDPLFNELEGLSIHESVYDELVQNSVRNYADNKLNSKLGLYLDKHLSEYETVLYNTYINKLSTHSNYDPLTNCKEDRGEVKSLSYMAVKGFMYFASNDNLPARLVEHSEKLDTGLGEMTILHPYDIIFYLYKKGYESKGLRGLYKYLYHYTTDEKRKNPCWKDFIEAMKITYKDYDF